MGRWLNISPALITVKTWYVINAMNIAISHFQGEDTDGNKIKLTVPAAKRYNFFQSCHIFRMKSLPRDQTL
jgi:hypothetical protein